MGQALETKGDQVKAEQNRRLLWIAFWVSVPFVALHLIMTAFALPKFDDLYRELGGSVPFLTKAVSGWGLGSVLLILSIDVLVFWMGAALARRHWIGLYFLPLAFYLVLPTILVWLVYAPMFRVENLIR